MNPRTVNGVLFDMGATLIEFETVSWEEMTINGAERGYRWLCEDGYILPDLKKFTAELMRIMDEMRTRALETLQERQWAAAPELYFSELGLKNPRALSLDFMDIFYSAVTDNMLVYDDSVSTLERLKAHGFKTGLISNTPFPGRLHNADLTRYGLKQYLDFCIFSSDFGIRKPHPDIFLAGLEQMKLEGERVVYVGDNYEWDVVGAQKAGLVPVLQFRKRHAYPHPIPKDVTIIYTLSELLDILGVASQ